MFLTLAHQIWKEHLKPNDCAIDATCGNGHDTAFLMSLKLSHLYVFDIQEKALANTQERVGKNKKISYHLECHTAFSSVDRPVNLIVYNLGYLPGGDKTITTRVETTLKSLERGLEILAPKGLMSFMLYPGHSEGAREESALLEMADSFSSKNFQVSHHRTLNRSSGPSLLLIHKIT